MTGRWDKGVVNLTVNPMGDDSPINHKTWRCVMLYWALMFLVVALVAGLLGFTTIGGAAYGFAKILFFVFLVLFLVSLVFGGMRRPVA